MGRTRWFLGGVLALMLMGRVTPLAAQPVKDDLDRLRVIQVELAWMADPELCCYYPCARIEGNAVKVGGYLPSAALRDKAIKIATLVTHLPTTDDIKVNPGCRFVPTQIPNDALIQSAALALKQRFPNEYRQWQLGMRGPGELVINGPADSMEKKLLVSERVRGLPGCKCVVNHLELPVRAAAPAPAAQAKSAPLLPLPPAPVAVKPGPAAASKFIPIADGPAKSPNTSGNQVVLGPSVLPMYGDAAAPNINSPRPIKAANQNPPGASAPTSGSSGYWQSGSSGPASASAPSSYPILQQPTPSPSQYKSVSSYATPVVSSAPPSTGKDASSFGHVVSYPSSQSAPVSVWQASNPAAPVQPMLVSVPATEQVLLSPPQAAPGGVPVKTVAGPSLPLPAAPVAAPALPLPAPTGKMVVSAAPAPTKVVSVPTPASPVPPAATAMPVSAKNVAELRNAIQNAGGPNMSKLQVNLTGNKLAVRFFAPNQGEAERLADLVMTMPALAAYWLELKVDVPR